MTTANAFLHPSTLYLWLATTTLMASPIIKADGVWS